MKKEIFKIEDYIHSTILELQFGKFGKQLIMIVRYASSIYFVDLKTGILYTEMTSKEIDIITNVEIKRGGLKQ